MATLPASPPASAKGTAALARCIVLLGLPGAGKSTVGAIVARRLRWRFSDLDVEIEADAGASIAEIFAREGEEGFRARETRLTRAISEDLMAGMVLAPGGGWIEDPANLVSLGPRLLTVYLRVSPLVAVGRMGEAASSRPLIAGVQSADRLKQLLRRRESLYLQANHTVNVDSMTPDEVADSIVALAPWSAPD